jgi:hypothetical protein
MDGLNHSMLQWICCLMTHLCLKPLSQLPSRSLPPSPQDHSLGASSPSINETSYLAQFPRPLPSYAWYGEEQAMDAMAFVDRVAIISRYVGAGWMVVLPCGLVLEAFVNWVAIISRYEAWSIDLRGVSFCLMGSLHGPTKSSCQVPPVCSSAQTVALILSIGLTAASCLVLNCLNCPVYNTHPAAAQPDCCGYADLSFSMTCSPTALPQITSPPSTTELASVALCRQSHTITRGNPYLALPTCSQDQPCL